MYNAKQYDAFYPTTTPLPFFSFLNPFSSLVLAWKPFY